MSFKEIIPSMFHRRLLLLVMLIALGFVVLGGQLFRLTIVQGAVHRDRAESKLIRERWTPTIRGRVLDRKDRVLARDRAGFNLVVDYRVITGAWAETQAMYYARKVNPEIWRELSYEQRGDLADQYLPVFDAHLDAMWDRIARETGTLREEIEERKAKIITRVTRMHEDVTTRRKIAELERKMARAEALADIDDQELKEIRRRTETEISEQESPHVIATRVSDDVGFTFLRLAEQLADLPLADPKEPTLPLVRDLLPGLEVWNVGEREYPLETIEMSIDRASFPGELKTDDPMVLEVPGVGTHILGWMRQRHYREDVQRRASAIQSDERLMARVTTQSGIDRGRYFPTDSVGHVGLESGMEDSLRGLRGVFVEYLDTGNRERTERTDGLDAHLTLDVMLQARVQGLMSIESGLAQVRQWHANTTLPEGMPLNGAAVVLDIDTAEILAMVSTPSFTRKEIREDGELIFSDALNTPWINRAIDKPYPPGSIVKPLILAGAITQGKLGLDERIACTGMFYPNNPNSHRCWIFKRFNTTHTAYLGHDLRGEDAIMVSCNIFFYTMGRRMGPDGLGSLYRGLGVGSPFNLNIGHEFTGTVGPLTGGALTKSGAVLAAIGQGPIAWTPLHAADAYATLARMGVRIVPRILVNDEPPEVTDLHLNSDAVRMALDGLHLSANSPEGTGHHITLPDGNRELIFNAPGVMIWGKTGTAQAPLIRADPDGDGPLPEQTLTGDHSWFTVLVGSADQARPQYAIAVVMEYAGSGGKVSGPIVNQIIHALIAEGYL